jgi:hypothetical protein
LPDMVGQEKSIAWVRTPAVDRHGEVHAAGASRAVTVRALREAGTASDR